MEQFAKIRRIKSKEEFDTIVSLAREDQHDVINPTDAIVKNGVIVGYFSIANVPIVIGHLSTGCLKARDSFTLINTAENIVERSGCPNVVFPVGQESPFHPLMVKMGYRKLATVDLFVKEF